MGGDKPKNPLDEFWEQIGDKEKKHVRSYRPNKRDLQNEKTHGVEHGKSNTDSRKRGC